MADLSDSQIVKGRFSDTQVTALEKKLVELFFERAKANGKTVELEKDVNVYNRKRDNGELFNGETLTLLVDAENKIADITPIVYHCIDTDVGLQYAKIMQQRGYLPPSEQSATS